MTTIQTTAQMELAFANAPRHQPHATCRQRRLQRAAWWFAQMRHAVDRALDWHTTPPPRAEQTWLPNTHREARA